jgi:hypothetical protein
MSAAALKHLENCFNQPPQNRGGKSPRVSYPVTLTPEDVRNFEENSLLGMFWSKE